VVSRHDNLARSIASAVAARLDGRVPDDERPTVGAIRTVIGREVVTAAGRYRVKGSWGDDDVPAAAVLVVVLERAPSEAELSGALIERHGLTRREAEVARMIARRRSTAEIAAALGISRHTARHHTERVLTKLGVRSRAAAAAKLAVDVEDADYNSP
jgi:DNA-binding CsgD family transcriptional regulator